jgi:hypothetical protein
LVLYGQKSIEAVAAERERKKGRRYWYESNQIFIGRMMNERLRWPRNPLS